MELLHDVQRKLDLFFDIYQLDKDPAFSRFIPMVYDPKRSLKKILRSALMV